MPLQNPKLILQPGREKSLLRRHPWIFSGAVSSVQGNPQPGDTVDLMTARGDFVGRAAYSPQSQIRARVWTWDETEPVDAAFIRRRLENSVGARQVLKIDSNAKRLVHAESDGLPGVIVDQYGDVVVLQCLSWGAERWRNELADAIMEVCRPKTLYERSDQDVRDLEGLTPRVGVLRGSEPASPLRIVEAELGFEIDIRAGHKTGFYLDQRANRLVAEQFSMGREVLDCFSYTGAFAAHVFKGGAKSVTLVDDSADALRRAAENLQLNELGSGQAEFIDGDVFQVLRRFHDQARQFDMVILDPPKFAPTKATAERAARGYKDINLLALKLLRPGGILLTFSCSGGIDADLFQKIVAGAALDAGVDARIFMRLSQAADHPVALNFPEGEYLKGLVVEVS